MNRLQAVPWRKWVPHILVICWIAFLWATIWDHASRSVVPPVYDPLGYLQKGINFWQSINHGQYVNPLNIVPASRPPGTILMSAPFGYPVALHWFYFRSVFFPLVCIVAAVYMAAGKSKSLAARWGIAATALLFSSLPMFYHFELIASMPNLMRFGLVDNFQAGVAAMAAAAFVRSLTNGSLRWLFAGGGMAAFTLLIKPSGVGVMALLGISWAMVATLEWFEARNRPEDSIGLKRYLAFGFILLSVIYSMVIVVCVKSQYLSAENFSFARKVLATAKDVLAVPLSEIPLLFHYSTGEAILIWTIGIVILFGLFWHNFDGLNDKMLFKMVGFLASATIIWSGGIWYWLVVQSGGNQIRYFYPFFLMGIVFVVPLFVHIWLRSDKWLRLVMVMVCFLPAVNMGLILVQKDPSIVWQKVTGVSVSVGKNSEVVKQAYDFLEMVRRRGENRNVYSFAGGIQAMIFENVGLYEKLVKPTSSTFITRHPIDWVNGFVTRLVDLLSSDYILFEPVKDNIEIQSAMRLGHIKKFSDESRAFHAWLTQLTEQDGIKVVSDDSVRLLEITDRLWFEHQITRFIAGRSWRPEFKAANPHRWWSASEVASYVNKEPAASDIRFGDLYKLHVIALSRVGKDIKIEFWWEELRHEDCNRQRRMFFHFVDSEGRIRSQQHISLAGYMPPHQDRRWRYGAIKFDPSIDSNISALAFGVWHPDSKVGILMADKGVRDWDGRRVVIPLNAGKEKK
jgi:hypothetical protein